jgi:hypothetical protein
MNVRQLLALRNCCA